MEKTFSKLNLECKITKKHQKYIFQYSLTIYLKFYNDHEP